MQSNVTIPWQLYVNLTVDCNLRYRTMCHKDREKAEKIHLEYAIRLKKMFDEDRQLTKLSNAVDELKMLLVQQNNIQEKFNDVCNNQCFETMFIIQEEYNSTLKGIGDAIHDRYMDVLDELEKKVSVLRTTKTKPPINSLDMLPPCKNNFSKTK